MVQGDPVFMRRVNGWFTIVWIVMIPISIGLHWVDSITYVSALSLWALVSGHWSAWQAARVEVNQAAEAEERRANDIPGEVVERIVEETVIDRVGQGNAGSLHNRVGIARTEALNGDADP